MKLAISAGINAAITNLVHMATEIAERVYNIADQTINILQEMGSLMGKCVQDVIKISNPLLYGLVRIVSGYQQSQVTIDMVRLGNAVDEMERIAGKIAGIDGQLAGLYRKLCINNIEQGEGIFTSLANLYNLSRADINVDEGNRIRRKASDLRDLFDEYDSVEKWVLRQLGG